MSINTIKLSYVTEKKKLKFQTFTHSEDHPLSYTFRIEKDESYFEFYDGTLWHTMIDSKLTRLDNQVVSFTGMLYIPIAGTDDEGYYLDAEVEVTLNP